MTDEWTNRSEYVKHWRITHGAVRTVHIPVDVLVRAFEESPVLQNELSEGVTRALRDLRERDE